ncbi:DUF3015 domain-containing protein [Lujinxingia sediminis]|uniref:DUF3015 domain-containing protein n=1 Tax=Lujinxingia sediminis TaxID=2480984 RepID=A0ABY0CVA3_9DELT|nr:DUF3015 family protein [Lujinxingia sediminis]RVU45791.1 DUF3015 domain-containing protein [Lujinxingia sediminis]
MPTRLLRSARHVSFVGIALVALALPSLASADHGHSSTTSIILIPGPFMSLTSSTSTTGAAFFAPMFTTVKLFADSGEASGEMVAFLNDHQRDLQQDLALGGGASIDALASMMGVEADKRHTFSQALFEERHALMGSLSHDQVGVEEATRFLSVLSDAGLIERA